MENQNKKIEEIKEEQVDSNDLKDNAEQAADNNPEQNGPAQDPNILEDQSMKSNDENEKDLLEAKEKTDNAKDGKFGEDVKVKNFNYAHTGGKDTNVVNIGNTRGLRSVQAVDTNSFVDIDPEEKNAARIQHTISHIAADVVKEGTPGCKEDVINVRDESNTAIERETMDSVHRVVGEMGTAKMGSAGGATQTGDVFMSTNVFADLTDKMYHTSYGHTSQFKMKGMDDINSVVLNEITPDGQIDRHHYRLIRQKHCLVVGINASPLFGTVQDQYIDVATLNRETGDAQQAVVRIKDQSNKYQLFKVVDLTATYDNIHNTCEDLLPDVTSLEQRAKLGEIEAIAYAMSREDLPISSDAIIPEDVELHPSYRRCSLYDIDATAFPGQYNIGCNNHIMSVAKLIKSMGESEFVWAKLRAVFGNTGTDIWNGYKMRKNIAGKDESLDYYSSTIKATILTDFTDNQAVPGINTFGAYINSNPHGRMDTVANFVYRFKDLQRKIEDYINMFGKNKKLGEILNTVTTQLSAVEHAADCLYTGKLKQNSNIDHIAKTGAVVGMLLNFDPNDFISFVPLNATIRFGGSKEEPVRATLMKPYVAVGYCNSFRVDTTKINATDTKVYTLAPSWISAICSIYTPNNTQILTKLYNASVPTNASHNFGVKSYANTILDNFGTITHGNATPVGDIIYDGGGAIPWYPKDDGTISQSYSVTPLPFDNFNVDLFFQPFYMYTDHPEWIDFFINEMLWNAGVNEYLDGNLDYIDGYMHLYNVFTTKSVNGNSWEKYIKDGGITAMQAVEKIITNAKLYPDPVARKVADLVEVIPSAQNLIKARNIDHQIAIFSALDGSYSIQLPNSRDFEVDDLGDYELSELNPKSVNDYVKDTHAITDKLHVIVNAMNNIEGNPVTTNPFILAPIGENEYIVCPKEPGTSNKINPVYSRPVLLKKKRITEEESRYTKRRHIIINDDADIIEHIGENIQDMLYGYDDMYYNEDCDGYCIKISMHYSPTRGIAPTMDGTVLRQVNLAPCDWTMSICPVKKFNLIYNEGYDFNGEILHSEDSTEYDNLIIAEDTGLDDHDVPQIDVDQQNQIGDCPCKGQVAYIPIIRHPLVNNDTETTIFGPIDITYFGDILDFGNVAPNYMQCVVECNMISGSKRLSLYTGKRYDVSNLMNFAASPLGWLFFYNYPDLVNEDLNMHLLDMPIGNGLANYVVEDSTEAKLSITYDTITYSVIVGTDAQGGQDLIDTIDEHIALLNAHIFDVSYRGPLTINWELFLPYTAYKIDTASILGIYNVNNQDYSRLSRDEMLRFSDLTDIDIDKPEYWDRKYYRTTGVYGRCISGMYDPQYGDPGVYDVSIYLANANLPLIPEVFLDIDSGTFTPADNSFIIPSNATQRNKLIAYHDWSVTILGLGDHVYEVVHRWKTPGNHISTETIPNLYEAFDMYANGEYCLPVAARWFMTAAVKDADNDDYTILGFMSTCPNNLLLNPILFSRFYRRDYCDYIVWKSLVTLNRRWQDRFCVNNKLSDSFRIDKKSE